MESEFCCDFMKGNLNYPDEETAFSDPDYLMYYSEKFDEYGLIIHDGGGSFVAINYCPWCGKKLPQSQRENWVLTLEKLGFDSPLFNDDIPEMFKSGAWRRYING